MASTLAVSRPSEKLGTHSTSLFMGSLIRRMNDGAAFHRQAAKIHTKIIRNFAVIGHVKHREVGILANFERADAVMLAQRVSWIDRRSRNCFRWSHAHLRACERENHRHADRGARAGIEIRRDSENRSSFDQATRRSVLGEAEMEAASRQQGA